MYSKKQKNEPIIQVRLHVQTRSSKYLVPGPGSHQAGDLFGDLSKRETWLSGGRPGKKWVILAWLVLFLRLLPVAVGALIVSMALATGGGEYCGCLSWSVLMREKNVVMVACLH